MQAIILAAGRSSRFYPYNITGHKSTVKILGKTVIEHTVSSIIKSGIKDIIIVYSPLNPIQKSFNVKHFSGVNIQFCEQKEPKGMGNALLSAKDLINSDFFLVNAHRVDFNQYFQKLISKKSDDNIILLAKEEKILDRYGVLETEGENVKGIIEKPQRSQAPSNYRVIGIYLFSESFIDTLTQTPIHHDQLEHAIDSKAKIGKVKFVKSNDDIISLKYPWDLLLLKDYLMRSLDEHISSSAFVAKSAVIEGKVHISSGSRILEGVCIKGPCYIGQNTLVGNNSLLRNGVDIEDNCVIGALTEIKNSIFEKGSSCHSGFIGDSIVGEGSRIGSYINCANIRLDRESILPLINNVKVESGRTNLGAIIGNNVKFGVNVTTMPGVIIGNNSVIGPGTIVTQNVDDNTLYYAKFDANVIKKRS